MTAPPSPLAAQAEALLNKKFARLREPSKYIATFRTAKGRHLGLTRCAKDDIFVWTECHEKAMPGVTARNVKFPGQPYAADQVRSSNITTHSNRLGFGNRAYYLKCESLGTLERLAHWYDSV